MTRRLVVAPHADDEVLGCGGLLAKYPDTAVALIAAPTTQRHMEMRRARSLLRLTGKCIFGEFTDGSVGYSPGALTAFLDDVFWDELPDEVYLPYPGSHQDHIAVFEAGMRACRQSLNPGHWMPPTVLVYETPTYDLDLVDRGLRFNVFESLTWGQVCDKAAAMGCYESQTQKPHAGSPDELRARARSLGLARDLEYAEQYAAVRMVRP